MKRLLLVVGLVACRNSDENFPVTPGGGGHGGSVPGADASFDVGDGGNFLGKVCLISDPRLPTSGCATTGAGGLIVSLGSNTATTADDGSFVIAATAATGAVWTVTGANIVPTVAPFTALAVIPALLAVPFADLENANGVVPTPGNGAVFVRVVQNSTAVAGATAIATNQLQYATLYDPASGLVWNANATGALGVAWLPGVLAGSQTVTVTPPAPAQPVVLSNVPIVEGALTFITAEVL
jgi:hypothetical protein